MSNITPALNDKVIQNAQAIYEKANGSTEKDFNKAYDQAIKEAGYSPAYFKKQMSKIGPECDMSDVPDEYFI